MKFMRRGKVIDVSRLGDERSYPEWFREYLEKDEVFFNHRGDAKICKWDYECESIEIGNGEYFYKEDVWVYSKTLEELEKDYVLLASRSGKLKYMQRGEIIEATRLKGKINFDYPDWFREMIDRGAVFWNNKGDAAFCDSDDGYARWKTIPYGGFFWMGKYDLEEYSAENMLKEYISLDELNLEEEQNE